MAKENLINKEGTLIPDNLVAGHEFPLLIGGVTLKSGQGELKRGTVIGLLTEDKKGVAVDKSKHDGSEIPYGILTDDVDATEEVKATVYTTGLFNRNALLFGGEDNKVTDFEQQLRTLGIHLKHVI